jgi:hypothetical protein
VEKARAIDKKTQTTHWWVALVKEMTNLQGTFETRKDIDAQLAREGKQLIGYTDIKCHVIFDIKMDGKFTRKARHVAGGHMT